MVRALEVYVIELQKRGLQKNVGTVHLAAQALLQKSRILKV